jgi:hypothetical protein
MSTEQNQPERSEIPAQAAPGGEGEGHNDGASGRSFRRRRRRKNRGSAGPGAPNGMANGPVNGAAGNGAGSGASPDGPGNSRSNSPSGQGYAGQNGQNFSASGEGEFRRRRKKKKKFYQGSGAAAPIGNRAEPGNSYSGGGGGGFSQGGGFGNGGGGRRKNKQRGPRQFVGPMDHSYRAVNGNYADAPPSTIAVNGNHGGGRSYKQNNHRYDSDHQSQFLPTVYETAAPVIPEDAPTRVFCFIEDLFFLSKITDTARKLGVKVAFVKGEKEDMARIIDAPEDERATLILLDLNNLNAKPLTQIPKIRAKLKKGVSIIGFLSHLQGDLKAKAMEVGCDTVMPRAAFSQSLPNLLRRYGLVDVEEKPDAQHAYF